MCLGTRSIMPSIEIHNDHKSFWKFWIPPAHMHKVIQSFLRLNEWNVTTFFCLGMMKHPII